MGKGSGIFIGYFPGILFTRNPGHKKTSRGWFFIKSITINDVLHPHDGMIAGYSG